tara:strand:+ start:995 stop:1201 length:207 start_codon:yes stop_codon:yes gene_type:complete
MEISKWNNIMKSFQDLLGYDKGTTEVIVIKRLALGRKSILEIQGREEKIIVHLLRKHYRQYKNTKNKE